MAGVGAPALFVFLLVLGAGGVWALCFLLGFGVKRWLCHWVLLYILGVKKRGFQITNNTNIASNVQKLMTIFFLYLLTT